MRNSLHRITQILLLLLFVVGMPLELSAKTKEPLPIQQLELKVQQTLSLKTVPSFRNITPQYTSSDIVHLQQTHAGLDIHQAKIAVRLDSKGNIVRIYGDVYDNTTNVMQAQKSVIHGESANEEQHTTTAIAYLNDNVSAGDWAISQLTHKTVMHKAESQNAWQLVYELTFSAVEKKHNRNARYTLLVDAQSRQVIEAYDQVHYSQQAGSGLGGNVMTGAQNYNFSLDAVDALDAQTFLVNRDATTCQMKVSPEPDQWQNNVVVYSGKDATEPYEYLCEDLNGLDQNTGHHEEDLSATLQAYSPLNDAAYHAQVAFNLYERFSVTQEKGPFNEIGRPLEVRAHYSSSILPSDNAFWNGEFIALGDGRTYFYPKVSADTLGHELAHAFLENYSLINQNGGIPMGISESFADIAGEATEYAIAQKQLETNDWKYAAQTFKPTLDDAARYFETPSLDDNSIDSPKHYNYEIKDGHFLAGPFNKAFYHLIQDNQAAGWNPVIGFDLWITAAANCWVAGIQYTPAAQCIVDSVETFRANNVDLPSTLSADDIRFSVIRAFAKADIMVQTDQGLVALFDYQRFFNDIILLNKTSLPDDSAVSFKWDVNNDGSVETQSTDLNTPVLVDVGSNDSVDINLIAQQNGQLSSYLRTIDLAPIYCTPSGDGKNQHFIKQVQLNNESYAESGTEEDGYGDYTSLPPARLDLNGKNVFTLSPNDDSTERYWAVYIDLNGDHDFTDDGEKLIDKVSDFDKTKGDLTETVELDLGLEHIGKLARMRVVVNWSVNVRPCGDATSGEHEDYLVLLSDIPDPSPSFSFLTIADSLAVNFTNTSELGVANATWSWRYKYPNETVFTEFSTQKHPEYNFPKPGRVTVELAMMTSTGDEYFIEQSLEIPTLNGEPLINFEIEVTKGSRDVLFVNQTTQYANDATWKWDYGDGKSTTFDSFNERHTHKYNTDKISDEVKQISITLTVNQDGQSFSHQQTIFRNELPKAGSLAWALPFFIWLLLVRRYNAN